MALKLKDSGSATKTSNELNFLGEGTYVEGIVETTGSLRVDGKIKGSVKTGDTLTIGASGLVSGEVHARSLILGGTIEGNVRVDEKIVLESKSTLIGNIKTKNLVIDEGAIFQGKSDMGAVPQTKKVEHPSFQPKEEFKEVKDKPDEEKKAN
ncbi:MAG: polymer-forming cytoskeletal protein [Calditrichia bacterium]